MEIGHSKRIVLFQKLPIGIWLLEKANLCRFHPNLRLVFIDHQQIGWLKTLGLGENASKQHQVTRATSNEKSQKLSFALAPRVHYGVGR